MTTLQEIADGLETVLDGIDGLRPHGEPHESPQPPTALVIFRGRERTTSCGGQDATFVVELSDDEGGGWSRSCKSLRPYLDATGTSSVEAAIRADNTLGGLDVTATVAGVGGERRVQFADGFRWVGEITVSVRY